jgi:GT2 family glycosyltransferase
MSAPIVSVVVVNWNGADHLDECLESLRRQTIRDAMQVVIVDNGSTDGSFDILRRFEGLIRLIRNETNVGFAVATNQGITASNTAYVALLNNDTVAEPDWLERLVEAMETAPDIGSCACKILSYYDREVLDNTGHVVFADGLTRGRGRLERDLGQYDAVEEVFCASGCAVLLRRKMLDDVGLMDEAFFAYCEDADLGFRARLRDWHCVYVPKAVIYHKFSASTESYSPFKAFHVERNRMWLAVKNLPLPLLTISPIATLQRYFWQAYGALRGRGAAGEFIRKFSRAELIKTLIRADIAAICQLPRVLRQRRQIQSRRKLSAARVAALQRRYGISARRIALMP